MVYKSRSTLPVQFDYNPKHKKQISFEGRREYYLFGLLPKRHEIFLDEEIYQQGFQGMSKIEIDDSLSFKNYMISLFTLGFYTPRNFEIKGFVAE